MKKSTFILYQIFLILIISNTVIAQPCHDERVFLNPHIDSCSMTGYYIPKNLGECFDEFDSIMSPKCIEYIKANPINKIYYQDNNKIFMDLIHTWMKFVWFGKNMDSRLVHYFEQFDDDYKNSSFNLMWEIMTYYRKYLNNEPVYIKKQQIGWNSNKSKGYYSILIEPFDFEIEPIDTFLIKNIKLGHTPSIYDYLSVQLDDDYDIYHDKNVEIKKMLYDNKINILGMVELCSKRYFDIVAFDSLYIALFKDNSTVDSLIRKDDVFNVTYNMYMHIDDIRESTSILKDIKLGDVIPQEFFQNKKVIAFIVINLLDVEWIYRVKN